MRHVDRTMALAVAAFAAATTRTSTGAQRRETDSGLPVVFKNAVRRGLCTPGAPRPTANAR
jgi:hypothetical protein